MAYPTDTFTPTDLAASIPEIWGDRINDYFKCELVFAPFFVNRSDEAKNGGNTIHTPGLVAMSAQLKTNAAAVNLSSPADTTADLVINKWYYVAFSIEDAELSQVLHSYNTMKARAENAGYEIARQLEAEITSLFSGFSQVVGASTTAIADSDILAAIATLDSNCVPGITNNKKDVAFFFHPAVFWTQIQAIAKFSLAINAPIQDPVSKTPAFLLYGIPVYTSNQIPFVSGSSGRRNVLAHKEAIHWAASPVGSNGSKGSIVGSSGIRIQANYMPEFLGTLVVADSLFGVVANRDNALVQILSVE